MEDTSREQSLPDFVKHHHVHFSVEPEWIIAGEERTAAGFTLRLFAVHDKGARALPAGQETRALAESLRSLAREILPRCEWEFVEIEPFSPALYDSREVPGADEVEIPIRLAPLNPEPESPHPSTEACLKRIRERMKRLGLVER